MNPIEIRFDKGTLIFSDFPKFLLSGVLSESVLWDERTHFYRAPAYKYKEIVQRFVQESIPFTDSARQFTPSSFFFKRSITPRPYQEEALKTWLAQKNGVVVLPTGAGKTILAILAIEATQRPTLIHVPTLDLMSQWKTVLQDHLDAPVGTMGGGTHDLQEITVATYDSALIHVPQCGNRFGLLIFDECHHLPGAQFQYTALSSIAPFRLGLTATPERSDGKEALLYQLSGELCYEIHIDELEGSTLASYEVVTVEVEMLPEEWSEYEVTRKKYRDFVKKEKIYFGSPDGWKRFLFQTSRTPEGRQAFKAYQRQKQLSLASLAKDQWIWKLIRKHKTERIILFTQDNDTAYRIGKLFFLPVLTHLTPTPEREQFLQNFRSGVYPILVTSKVLNEGVDVPEASVGIVVSGSGSTREHVQRLGRILRARKGKTAKLYELISKGTGEYHTNKRRRQHRAYQK